MVEKFMHLADCSDDSVPSRAFRDIVDVVCVGDSITGWNNCDDRSVWISPTYPELLAHELASRKRDLTVVDCGMAGEKSYYAAPFARTFLELFPHSRYFVIGFGANDLGDAYSEIDKLSKEIVGNLDEAVDVVLKARRKPILLNVPHLGNAGITPYVAERHRERRDFFNRSLKSYSCIKRVKLVDICSKLGPAHFVDGLHPNIDGARIIAGAVADVLVKRPRSKPHSHI